MKIIRHTNKIPYYMEKIATSFEELQHNRKKYVETMLDLMIQSLDRITQKTLSIYSPPWERGEIVVNDLGFFTELYFDAPPAMTPGSAKWDLFFEQAEKAFGNKDVEVSDTTYQNGKITVNIGWPNDLIDSNISTQ